MYLHQRYEAKSCFRDGIGIHTKLAGHWASWNFRKDGCRLGENCHLAHEKDVSKTVKYLIFVMVAWDKMGQVHDQIKSYQILL